MRTVDEAHLDGVLYERTFDNEDGTGSRVTYHPDGSVASTTPLSDIPVPEPAEPSPAEQIAALQETVDALLALIAGE